MLFTLFLIALTSIATALQINRVQSNKCCLLTTGNIFAVMT